MKDNFRVDFSITNSMSQRKPIDHSYEILCKTHTKLDVSPVTSLKTKKSSIYGTLSSDTIKIEK